MDSRYPYLSQSIDTRDMPDQCSSETATRYCVLNVGHIGPHVDGIATWVTPGAHLTAL